MSYICINSYILSLCFICVKLKGEQSKKNVNWAILNCPNSVYVIIFLFHQVHKFMSDINKVITRRQSCDYWRPIELIAYSFQFQVFKTEVKKNKLLLQIPKIDILLIGIIHFLSIDEAKILFSDKGMDLAHISASAKCAYCQIMIIFILDF